MASSWGMYVCHCGDDIIDAVIDVVYSSIPSEESWNIFKSVLFRLTNFKVMTRDVGFDTKASFSNNTCSHYI
jgi:hypothetical protein